MSDRVFAGASRSGLHINLRLMWEGTIVGFPLINVDDPELLRDTLMA